MNKSVRKLIIVSSIASILCIGSILTQRNLVSYKQDVQEAKSNIEVQYQRRNDLIPNIINTVKGQAQNEKEVYTQIAELRSQLSKVNISTENTQTNEQIGSSLNRLIAIAEQYPNLKQNQGFENLRIELEGTENRIATARENYNDNVRTYNNKIHMFPSNIVAKILGYNEEFKFIQATKDADKPVQIVF